MLVPSDPHNQVSTADPQPASLKFDEKIPTHPKTLLHLQAPQLETAALEAQTHVQEAPDAHLSVDVGGVPVGTWVPFGVYLTEFPTLTVFRGVLQPWPSIPSPLCTSRISTQD